MPLKDGKVRKKEIPIIKEQMIRQYIEKIKKCVANGHLAFAPRDKNVEFMREYGLVEEDIKDIILDLEISNYFRGPSKDHNPKYSGDIWEFKYKLELDEYITIYIKVRYNPPEKLVCISFHLDEI